LNDWPSRFANSPVSPLRSDFVKTLKQIDLVTVGVALCHDGMRYGQKSRHKAAPTLSGHRMDRVFTPSGGQEDVRSFRSRSWLPRGGVARRTWLWLLLLTGFVPPLARAITPNIIIIYADDLGYGDVGAYGAKRIATPNIDRLAREGVRFTSGYASTSVCTPSRYALLTGEYPWRRAGSALISASSGLLIEPGRLTLGSMLQNAGYRTAIVGKWHLGLGKSKIDWNREIKPGPLEVGFSQSFIMPLTNDRVPCVYVEGHRVVGLDPADPLQASITEPIPGVPTARTHPELLTMRPSHGHDLSIINGISRIGYMKGGRAAWWRDEEMSDVWVREALKFIHASQEKPFMLFLSLHSPHAPRIPHPRFVGTTDLGPRGDVIVETDWCAGEILRALDNLGIARNTLVIFTSDNGPVIDDGYQDDARERLGDHRPWGPFRGGKYGLFEAGCRVPFIVRWPARIRPGVSDALVSQVDLLASLAALTGQRLSGSEGPDSVNVLPALLGESSQARDHFVLHSPYGVALRQGRWKLIPANKGPRTSPWKDMEFGNDSAPQLYDLAADPGERVNLASAQPERVKVLAAALEKLRAEGRTAR